MESSSAFTPSVLERWRRRENLLPGLALIALAAAGWAYVTYQAASMGSAVSGMAMGSIEGIALFLSAWAVMMVAMMVPTAAPMILLFAMVNRRRQEQQRPFVPTAVFLLGYVLVWSGFAALAALAQWGLHTATLLSPVMVSTSPFLGGTLLLAAGIYQWTPLKYVCLSHCRTPWGFSCRSGGKGIAGHCLWACGMVFSAWAAAGH